MKKIFVTVILIVSMFMAQSAFAESYNIDFARAGHFNYNNMYTPLRGTNLANEFTRVNSTYNQPRDEGTSPHKGVDLMARAPRGIYPVWWGWPVSYESKCEILLQLDLDKDGKKEATDNVYVLYDHLSNVGEWNGIKYVDPYDKLGASGNENGRYNYHLHFGFQRDGWNSSYESPNNLEWSENEPYYRGYSGWDYGKNLDLAKYAYFDVGLYATACIYGISSGTVIELDPGEVYIFHRLNGTSRWAADPMTADDPDAPRWWTFRLFGRYPAGAKVDWMIRVIRKELPDGFFDTAFYPAKYYQPNQNPNNTSNKYDYFTNTIYR